MARKIFVEKDEDGEVWICWCVGGKINAWRGKSLCGFQLSKAIVYVLKHCF
jgi:hypothetical protein